MENMKWNMLLLYKIEKQVNQGNIHPQLGRKIKTAIKQKTENKEAKKKEKKTGTKKQNKLQPYLQ